MQPHSQYNSLLFIWWRLYLPFILLWPAFILYLFYSIVYAVDYCAPFLLIPLAPSSTSGLLSASYFLSSVYTPFHKRFSWKWKSATITCLRCQKMMTRSLSRIPRAKTTIQNMGPKCPGSYIFCLFLPSLFYPLPFYSWSIWQANKLGENKEHKKDKRWDKI